MTSETEAVKTNEFLRRRKLRLQQVREQSKDIAKKIRQRAKVEKLRQVVDLDSTKQKEYLECQDKLIKHLEVLYARGLDKVGASHQSASELTQKDVVTKTDLSKLRGKEAAAALRKQKQEKLDQQKKLLDRKLQARETANEISRDKSTAVAQKLISKSTNTNKVSDDAQTAVSSTDLVNTKESNRDAEKVTAETESVKTNDMATQWDIEAMPPEWEPAVPALSLPIDKDSSPRGEDNAASKTDKQRLDLFALSKEMPSSLRGKYTHESRPRETTRPSLTLVSEYLQSRKLRLRENDTVNTNKKPPDDINSLKQTILHTRSTKPEGSNLNVCHVLDEQIIPVPSWRAELSGPPCQFCFHSTNYHTTPVPSKQFQGVTNSQINQIFSSIRPVRQPPLLPSPVLRGTSPFRRNKVSERNSKGQTSTHDKPKTSQETPLNRKSSVMIYNHSTRDTRDLPCGDNKLVVRDKQSEEDAYSQAMKEVSSVHDKGKEHQRKVQDMRNKVAVTKQNVEKEYKDTMNFLNSLPKKSDKVNKTAYMDARRQQAQQESRQQKLQEEYKKIEKECKKRQCLNKSRSKSKSPAKPARQYLDDNFDTRDFQYSWMPVPESDSNLAIHAIPNTVKQKSSNSVKFSTVDSYHEYRSRHKHTPPTKDTQEKQPKKVEAVIIDKDDSDSSDSSVVSTSDTSSVQNLILDEELKSKNAKEINKNLSDAERIIIYKVLDSRADKKSKKQTKLLNEIAKSLSCIEQGQKSVGENNSELSKKPHTRSIKSSCKTAENAVSFEQLNEGVYKMVEEQGDNITSMYFNDQEKQPAETVSDKPQSCHCDLTKEPLQDKNTPLHWESGDCLQPSRTIEVCRCGSVLKGKGKKAPSVHPSSGPSTSSFITASNVRGSSTDQGGYIKLLDETGQEAGKFFIGASALLKNNTYEVVLQLRKKDEVKDDKPANDNEEFVQSNPSGTIINSKIDEKEPPTSSEADTTDTNDMQQPPDVLHDDIVFENIEKQDSEDQSPKEIPNDEAKHNVSEVVMTDKHNHSRNNAESSEHMCLIQTSSETKDKRDQSVHTGHDHVPNPDMPAKPAKTTFTQTTLSSPTHRPVFFHMSSSTSTAYMSPPEMILPKYFRRNRRAPEDELYDVLYDPVETIEMTEREYCEEYSGCTCRKCMLARKITLRQNTHVPVRKRMYDIKKIRTPPNTVRSPNDHRNETQIPHPKKVTTSCRTARLEKGKCRYNGDYGEPVKKQCRRSRRSSEEGIPSTRNLNVHAGVNLKSRNKVKISSSSHDKLGGSRLNPIIKDYINKLLALNRQGLKAVEVADQECSSVGTPGSSIINVPNNVDENKSLGNKISLEHIKSILKRQLIEKQAKIANHTKNPVVNNNASKSIKKASSSRLSRKKSIHKVKSLNISKHLIKKNLLGDVTSRHPVTPSSTDDNFKPIARPKVRPNRQTRSKSSPTPRRSPTPRYIPEPLPSPKFNDTASTKNSIRTERTDGYLTNRSTMTVKSVSPTLRSNESDSKYAGNSKSKVRISATSPDTETTGEIRGYKHTTEIPVSMSTQTNQNTDSDTKFMKLAEDKLLNMEKIADLTEKCTKRLSNLAKVLEEVRKNKSLAYSQISSADSTDSQSDHKSDKATIDGNNIPQRLEIKSPEPILDKNHNISKEKVQSEYMTVLTDIPKPVFKSPVEQEQTTRAAAGDRLDAPLQLNVNTGDLTIKSRPKPPPALSRINLKHGQEYIVPHELSTVLEVDSPMSTKHKNQTSRNDVNDASNNSSPGDKLKKTDKRNESAVKDVESSANPDLLASNANYNKKFKFSSTESSDESKFQMIDLKHFNEIMLEPFISIQEYAKQYNMEPPDEGSNLEQRDDVINDDLSSLHSDGSLPDVIAELLKRNIIAEPFKYDTASNVNSTTISSESTLSMLALSKVRKDRKRSGVTYQNKESIAETSDTLSISSNPDLENAFKKLGMGWASSTLKKTKERLALSSSSNTSSSSIPHFKMKSFNQDIPALVSDSVSSALNSSNKQSHIDSSKNAEQQTTLSNSMTVKEFLRNELAKKITFNNKSNINDSEEFVSLFETKMPEDMKENSQMNRDDRSMDSVPSGTNRARTSTPVQIYRSMTYHSSSSSNVSHNLFSNADDLSSVKMTSNSIRNHSTSDKDDLTIPNFSLRVKKTSDCSKSD